MRSKLRASGIDLLVALGSLVFLFAALEVAARVFLPRPDTVLVDKVDQEKTAATPDKELRVRSGLGGYSLFRRTDAGLRLNRNIRMIIRNHQLSHRNVEIRTNAYGYRGDDIPEKTDKDFRVLVLGDSITLADYVPEELTFPAYMERRLAQLGTAQKTLRVINAGTSSIDLRSELMILMESGLQTRPDVIVEALYLNDADVSFTLNAVTYPPSVRWSRLLTFLMGRTNYLHTALQVRARREDRKEELDTFVKAHPASPDADWREGGEGFNREVASSFRDWGYAWTDDAWKKMEETLILMKQVAADHDAELFVMLLPVRQQVEATKVRDEPQQQFGRIVSRLRLRHLDVLPLLREKFAADKTDFFYDHCHFRPEGNELVGRALGDVLARESNKLHKIGVSWRADGPGAPASLAPAVSVSHLPDLLNRPLGLRLGPNGELLVADEYENAVLRVGTDGRFRGRFSSDTFKQPNGVAFDGKGVVYVADTWNQRVARFAPDGSPLGDLPTPGDGGYYAPRDVVVAPSGDVFVANTGRARIERYQPNGTVTHWGENGDKAGQFHEPLGLAVADHELYVVDYGNARVQVFRYEGRWLRTIPVTAWQGASMGFRPGIAIFRDRLYVSDAPGNAILIYSKRGQELGAIKAPEIVEPSGLEIDADGTLYVANLGNGLVVTVDLKAKEPVARVFAPHTLAPPGH